MSKPSVLSDSMENYLEAILRLVRGKGAARVKDIARETGAAVSSVSNALRTLAERGLANYQPYEPVTLTAEGERIAQRVDRRHRLISRFFRDVLGVAADTASEDACRLEHGISAAATEQLMRFMEFVDKCPRMGGTLVERFRKFCAAREGGPDLDECAECVQGPVAEVERRAAEAEAEEGAPAVLKLSELEPGRGGRVRKVSARGRFARRMLDMGIVCGSPVRVIKVAPLGDPMEVELKGYRLSLRRSEADMVLVEVPEGEHGHP